MTKFIDVLSYKQKDLIRSHLQTKKYSPLMTVGRGEINLSWEYPCIHMHGTVLVKGKEAVISRVESWEALEGCIWWEWRKKREGESDIILL